MLKRAFLQNKDKPVTIDADDLDDSSREATGKKSFFFFLSTLLGVILEQVIPLIDL